MARRVAGLRMSEAARRAGIRPARLRSLEETGKRPEQDLLERLSDVYGLSADALWSGSRRARPLRTEELLRALERGLTMEQEERALRYGELLAGKYFAETKIGWTE